jgi:hypothetical protein
MTPNYKRYLENTYAGKSLLENHGLNEYGVWEVFGEDPNPDMGGHHHEPKLGMFEGTLQDVIMHGVDLPSFWQWGGGGRFVKSKAPVKIDKASIAREKELVAELDKLMKRIKEINKELDSLSK